MRDSALDGIGGERRARLVRHWVALVEEVVRMPRGLRDALTEQLRDVTQLLDAELTGAWPGLREELVAEAVTGLRRAARALLARQWLHTAPGEPLPLPLDSPDWEVLLRFHGVADRFTRRLLAMHLHVGGGALGAAAVRTIWDMLLRDGTGGVDPRPLRLDPHLDEATYLLLTADGAPVEVVVAPVTDAVEILRVAHLVGGGRDDDLDDASRAVDQALFLHQDAVLIGAHLRRPDGTPGELLAGISAIRTDGGLLFLDRGAVAFGVEGADPAFGDYLSRRAPAMGTVVVVTEEQHRLHPPGPLEFTKRPVVLAAPVLGAARIRAPALLPPGGPDVALPHVAILRVAVVPPAG